MNKNTAVLMKIRVSSFFIFISLIFLIIFSLHVPAFAQDAKITALNQAVSQWLQNPDDKALGKTMVSQARALKGRETPDDYDLHRTRGQMAFKDAKSPDDFKEAVTELESSTQAAPWLAEGWYNLGMARKMAKDYVGAENDLKLYLLLTPRAKDAKKVKEAIYGLGYEVDRAAKESSPEAIAEREKNEAVEFYKKYDGKRFVWHNSRCCVGDIFDETLDFQGETIICGETHTAGKPLPNEQMGVWSQQLTLQISKMRVEDGRLVLELGESKNNFYYEKVLIGGDGRIMLKNKPSFQGGGEVGPYQ